MATVTGVSWLVRSRGKGVSTGVTTLVLAIAVGLATAAPTFAALPTPISAVTAKTYLGSLTVGPENNSPAFDRSLFPTWDMISGNCDTRGIVLIRDGTDVITDSSCRAISGDWLSPYDGLTTTVASDLDIDHIVPLKEAWVSGARLWTTRQREAFANDLTRPQLVAITDNAKQSKGDQDPATWVPMLPSFVCTYVRAYIQVKHFYNLSVDPAEKVALVQYLETC
ncbi:MAG: hypothetical protein J3R72DRAFT_374505 [Linnemannia gamsii]|nr:MAG: hypothetical protein J3R72DRAFT_374505 [Linnemannia gamsii]